MFRILTYNIHKGASATGARSVLDDIKRTLKSSASDLLFLQEIQGQSLTPPQSPLGSQFEYLADTVWPHYAYGMNAIYDSSNHGNAILSKFPIIEWKNIDLSTNSIEHRGLLHARIQLPRAPFVLNALNVHLNLSPRSRKVQATQIADYIAQQMNHSEALILGGDFNDWSRELDPFFEKIGLTNAFGKKAIKTFPSFMPFLTLDRIYSRGLQLNAAYSHKGPPWNQLSDHLPLSAEFKMADT